MKKSNILISTFLLMIAASASAGVKFHGALAPAEGLVWPQEKPQRAEVCLNGYWEVQCLPLPAGWQQGVSETPELPMPKDGKWDDVKIKIPSAINVNNWGNGANNGEGTPRPYAPSSVYYPSYPEHWAHARWGWLRKNATVPADWTDKRVVLHFEAVAGDCDVYIDGRKVGHNFDQHLPFDVDITEYVEPGKEFTLMLGLRHSKMFDKRHPVYSKMGAIYPPGSNTDDLIGIWQDVFMWGVPAVNISDVFVKPLVDKNILQIDVTIDNKSPKDANVAIKGEIRPWQGHSLQFRDPVLAAEPDWTLGDVVLDVLQTKNHKVAAGESKIVTIEVPVDGDLEYWTPDTPNLYALILNITDNKKNIDTKATRFGWRQLKIDGSDFVLNGKKIQCFGDIQHPFSAYICSRRFAWAWYKMIKDFGGNAVRPHAQPWPRVYYDLADEMGLMVLDETGLFGSSIRLNFEEDALWQNAEEQLHRLIMRDRNHPSVIGWSPGNELFAIALLNNPDDSTSAVWDQKMVDMALTARRYDDTRDFITLDGDRDMDGRLPVWSKHFAHGLNLGGLPKDINKPLIVGECGATYYGRPEQLYPFAGDSAYINYEGRNKALAVDIYQNIQQMAKPYLAYFSPSEVCWFGIEHLGLGYSDYSRLPNVTDGIFPADEYREGVPGYQYERIPPYVTTFNPGLDPSLPVYKPLAMFEAMKAAMNDEPWPSYPDLKMPALPDMPDAKFSTVWVAPDASPTLLAFVDKMGIAKTNKPMKKGVAIVDASTVTKETFSKLPKGTTIVAFVSDKISDDLASALPGTISVTDRKSTALEPDATTAIGSMFTIPSLYFAEIDGDRYIQKHGLDGTFVNRSEVALTGAQSDWTLFNNTQEAWKCAQEVLFETLEKPNGAAVVCGEMASCPITLIALDYTLDQPKTREMWVRLLTVIGIKTNAKDGNNAKTSKEHDLLMDGPVD